MPAGSVGPPPEAIWANQANPAGLVNGLSSRPCKARAGTVPNSVSVCSEPVSVGDAPRGGAHAMTAVMASLPVSSAK